MFHRQRFGLKMPQRNNCRFQSVLLIFLLIFGVMWRRCESQVSREEANKPPDGHGGHGGDGSAFFALRSCHQLLHGDSGEFFSPDYLCSNPPLWCNWTIQVDPAKKIQLHLEDLTPDDACRLKDDQLHVDQPGGHSRGHRVLQRCWREAKFTSSSNIVHVVLLIGGWPSAPYRGFYGRYQVFGPPVVYNPQDGLADRESKSPGLVASGELVVNEQMESENPSPADPDLMYDYYDQLSARTSELGSEEDTETDAEEVESHQENHVHPSTALPTVPASTQGTSRSGRGAAKTPSNQSDSDDPPESQQQQEDGQNQQLKPTTSRPTAGEEDAASEEERPADGESRMKVSEASDQLPIPSAAPDAEETAHTHAQPNMVEPLSDHRGSFDFRNHSEIPHLPGDHLLEVTVEVNFSDDLKASWDSQARSLLRSVQTAIGKRLEALQTPLSMTAKRVKRLHAGALYIIWLQIGQGPGGLQVYKTVQSTLQGLVFTDVGVRGNHRSAVIMSITTADVNECGTLLVLCDINADCVNWIGTYSCRCRPGFQDKSRVGSGGTVCVDTKAAGCSSGLSAETKGVYALFFLLSCLILTLLAAAGLLYHRHRRGAFLVRCHSGDSMSPADNNNHHRNDDSYSGPADSALPPPPPPARGFRDSWPVKERFPAVELPLLRFSPLLPSGGYTQEGGKT